MAIKKLRTKELIQKTAASSKYFKYEVEDIVMHFIAHIQKSLADGVPVKIDGVGSISRKLYKPRNVKFDNVEKMVYNSVGLSIKADADMRKNLKEKLNAEESNVG